MCLRLHTVFYQDNALSIGLYTILSHTYSLIFITAAEIEWELDCYQFEEGVNMTFEICAVVANGSEVTVVDTRQVIFRNGTASGM